MHFHYKKQKLFLTLFIVAEFFTVNVLPASALFGGPSIPSASSIMSDVEQRYHLGSSTLQNLGESMNVSGGKGTVPAVSLSFSPNDPKPGEKLSAKAFPMYFSNEEKSLYFTWYLKRKGCNIKPYSENNPEPSGTLFDSCDANKNGKITIEDWKISAAQIIAQSGYDNSVVGTYTNGDNDNDGYKANFGGDNKINTPPPHCFINDTASGTNYEIVDKISDGSSNCPDTVYKNLICVVAETATDPDTGMPVSNGQYTMAGRPACSTSDGLTCGTGTVYCSSTLTNIKTASLIAPTDPTTCFPISADPLCVHLFPFSYKLSAGETVPTINTTSGKSDRKVGDEGKFGINEERFWGTNPNDPSTADNGNKDEANVVGLGQSTFSWDYDSGDKVGVAVEGASMFPTKFADSSYMIMWAFPKNDCSAGDLASKTGAYVQQDIKGYDVSIDAAEGVDLNDCVEKNLVDPTEGGQATKLSVSVSATPDNPINDPSAEKSGDTITTQATVDNSAQSLSNIFYDWRVYIGSSISSFTNGGGAEDITDDLRNAGLLGNIRGNALDSISLKLNIVDNKIKMPLHGGKLSDYLISNVGYLKFQVATQESFAGGGIRKGNKTDGVIVKFISSTDSITTYSVLPVSPSPTVPGDTTRVKLDETPSGKICTGITSATDPLEKISKKMERTVCPVVKNKIIGLKVDGTGLSNFNWTINGSPLFCTARVSGSCANGGSGTIDTESQGATNFFPVTGNPGDTYTVTMTANDIASGKTVTLTRNFNVVEPKVVIKSDNTLAWQKVLGQYIDVTSTEKSPGVDTCPGGFCDDLSESIYQAYSGSDLQFKATFIPGFLSNPLTTKKEWSVDGETKTAAADGSIKFTADKQAGGVYTINLLAQVVQSVEVRKALLDIWGISPFDSPEINFASSIQVEIQEQESLTQGPLSGPRKYYAAIASYIPASILFTFRIFLSVALTLFVLALLNSLLEERRLEAFVRSFSRSRDK